MTVPLVPMRPATLEDHIAARNAEVTSAWPEAAANAYLPVLATRAAAFAAHVASMEIAPEVAVWALAMARQFGSFVRVHHFVADWITALLILRYGEEPDASKSTDPNFAGWPKAFTAEDLVRAQQLLSAEDWPRRVFRLLPRELPVTAEEA